DLLYGATRIMCEAVEDNRGTVCRFMGDGVMAMFGAPVAREHHAVDACEAALQMQSRIRAYAERLGTGADHLAIRVGLHSGEVVVLNVGDENKAEYDASGPTVPMAARMEQSAAPGEIYITDATRALAAGQIEADPIEPVRVKGISEPVPVFVLRRVRPRAESELPERSTPFVGREAEVAQFTSILQTVSSSGHGHSVFVRGEPGIGKTRLTEEFIRLSKTRGFNCHKGLVLDFGVGKGHEAIRALVRSLLDIPLRSGETERQAAADAAFEQRLLDPDQRVFLNDLLDLPQPVNLRALYDAMDNATRNRGKQKVVAELVKRRSAKCPILLLIEDVHWAQPLTLAHLANLALTVGESPAILLMTSRIEQDPLGAAWRGTASGAPLITMDLGPLRSEESERLASGLTDAAAAWVKRCIDRAEGNPLFLEQLLRTAEENAQTVPDSIQTLVLARMDRLSATDKRAFQAASVIGQRFALDALRHLIGDLSYDCRELVAHQLIRPEGEDFLFAHALIQESVYSSMVKQTRHSLHRRAAEWFEGSDVVLHAQHLDQADDPGAVGAYLLAVGAQMDNYRYEFALQLCDRGLKIAGKPSERHRFACLKSELLLDLGEVDAAMDAAQGALKAAADNVQKCEAWILLASVLRMLTDYHEALKLLDTAEPVATAHRLSLQLSRLHHLRGNLCFPLGRIETCREEHDKALQFARRADSLADEARALGGLGDADYARGRMRNALDNFNACVELCRKHGFGRIEVAYLAMVPYCHMYLFDVTAAEQSARRAIDAASAVGHQRAEMNARNSLCHIFSQVGDWEASKEQAVHARELCKRLGASAWEPHIMMWQGLAENALGQRTKAYDLLRDAVDRTVESKHTFNTARIFGAFGLITSDSTEREEMLQAGESVLGAGTVSHNHFWFYQFAIMRMLELEAWDRVDHYAQALHDFTRPEPLPLTDFYTAYGRSLAAYGRGERSDHVLNEIRRLRDQAQEIGLKPVLPMLERALATAA
ncbi:MAG: adenylate/guanylate cyclase domain-containing protein, partial [Gammaproteobacteria bacterium]|nr:adenylate/guanylate cyclase domain-containing protein [Gammaproteobacteria bacterium]